MPIRGSLMLKGRGAAPLILLLACSTSRSSESQSSYAQKVDTVTERGAVKVTTTVREYAPPKEYTQPSASARQSDERGSRDGNRHATDDAGSVAPAVPDTGHSGYGPLIREIVRVTERDPVVTHTDSAAQASGSAEAESKSRPFGLFALLAAGWPFLLGACGAAALVILRPPWLIAGWSLVKSLFGKGN